MIPIANACWRMGCVELAMNNERFCSKHYTEEMSTSDPLSENGPYEGDKFVKFNGNIYEVKNRDNTAMSITSYNIAQEHLVVPLASGRIEVPTILEVQKYLKEREAHMRRMMEPVPEPDPEASVGSFEGQLGQVLAEMNELLLKKNKDYGSSYDKTVEELGETVILIRIMDKFNRLKQLIKSGDPAEVEETIEETLSDLVGYGIIELVRRRRS